MTFCTMRHRVRQSHADHCPGSLPAHSHVTRTQITVPAHSQHTRTWGNCNNNVGAMFTSNHPEESDTFEEVVVDKFFEASSPWYLGAWHMYGAIRLRLFHTQPSNQRAAARALSLSLKT